MAGGKSGFVVSQRPARYKNLPQQERLKKASEFCKIKKGMSRADLIKAMKECIPKYFAKEKGEGVEPSP